MKKIAPIVLLIISWQVSWSQMETLRLTLPEIVVLAQSDAPDVLIAETRLTNRYWFYQTFLADLKPQISFVSNNIPSLNRSIDPITLPDGSLAFVNRSLMQNGMGLQLTQNIAATGGTVFTSTNLERIDIFATDGIDASTSYLSTPISVGFVQPIFGFNRFKWDQKIEPIRYEESKRAYSEDLEDVAFDAASLFFEILNAQLNVEAAQRDRAAADTLYNISKGRFDVGRIAETDLLQIELNARNAEAALAAATLNFQSATERMRDFLGLQNAVRFELTPPSEIPTISIDAESALQYALSNRSAILNFQRRLVEADQEVARAKGETGLDINVTGSFGLSQTAKNIGDAYQDPLDQQRLRVSLEVPIADWGKTKARRETAASNKKLTEQQVSQDRIAFEREILLKVQQFDLVRNQVLLAERTYEVAQKRNNITRQRYLIGKIGITELNLALNEQENARQSYVQTLQDFWLAYYDLRRLTLYDFVNDKPLIKAVEEY